MRFSGGLTLTLGHKFLRADLVTQSDIERRPFPVVSIDVHHFPLFPNFSPLILQKP